MVDKIPVDPLDPFIYGTGRIISGDARNIVPSYAKIEGSIRTVALKKSEEYYEKFRLIPESIRFSTGVDYRLTKGECCPEVLVDSKPYGSVKKLLSDKYNFIDCGYKMTDEDFFFFSHMYPSFTFRPGTGRNEKYGLHNPKFLPNDSIIDTGINIFSKFLDL